MKGISWSEEFSIDHGTLDDEQKIAFFIVNRFIEMGRHFRSPDHALEFLEALILHSKYHFHHEEEYMLSIEYPLYQQHKMIHKNILDELKQIIAKLKKTKGEDLTETSRETAKYLKYWLTQHVLVHDMDIKTFVEGETKIEQNSVDVYLVG